MSSIDDPKMPASFSLPFLHNAPDSPPRSQKEKQLASKWWTSIQKQRHKGTGDGLQYEDERKQSLSRLCKGCWCHGCSAEFHGQEKCNCEPPEKERTPIRHAPNAPLTPPTSLESIAEEKKSKSSRAGEANKKLQKVTTRQVHFLPAPKPIKPVAKPIAQSLLPSPAISESETPTGFDHFSFNFQNPRSDTIKEESVPPSYDDIVEDYSQDSPDRLRHARQAPRKESAPAILQKPNMPVRQPKWNVFPNPSAGQGDRRVSTTEAKWLAGNLKNCEPWLQQVPNSRSRRNFSIVEMVQDQGLSEENPANTAATTDVIPEDPKEDAPSSLPRRKTRHITQSSNPPSLITPQTPHSNTTVPTTDISHFSPDTPPRSPDRPQTLSPDQMRPLKSPDPAPPIIKDRPKTLPVQVRSFASPPRAVIPVRFKRRGYGHGHSRSASGSLARTYRAECSSPLPQLDQPPQRSFSVDETGSKFRRKLGVPLPGKQSPPQKTALCGGNGGRRQGHEVPPPSPPSATSSGSSSSRRIFRAHHSRHPSSLSSSKSAISPTSSPRSKPPPINFEENSALLSLCTLLEPPLFQLQSTLRSFPALTLRLDDPVIRRLRSNTTSDAAHIATLGRVFAHAPPPLLSALAASTIAEGFLKACFSLGLGSASELGGGNGPGPGPGPGSQQGQQQQQQFDTFVARLRATEGSADPLAASSSSSPSALATISPFNSRQRITTTTTAADSTADLTSFTPQPGQLLNLNVPFLALISPELEPEPASHHHRRHHHVSNPSPSPRSPHSPSSPPTPRHPPPPPHPSHFQELDALAYARALGSRAKVLQSSLEGVIGALLEAVCGESGDLVCRRFLGVLVEVVEDGGGGGGGRGRA